MQIPISEVIILRRVRQDLGDLEQLMESMQKHGLLNPIVVTSDHELVAGHRRLESARRLGWLSIEARILSELDDVSKLRIEVDENIHRAPLTQDELAEAYERLKKLQKPRLTTRLRTTISRIVGRFFRRRR